MNQNLEKLRTEIEDYLATRDLAVFRGFVSDLHEQRLVFWDVDRTPDYKAFVACAERAGIRLVIYNSRDFRREMVDEALERLEESELPKDDIRPLERRLRELKPFDGFTCGLELAFELENRIYVFDLRTEWYGEFLDLLDQIDGMIETEGFGDEDDESLGGYFSRN